MYIERTHLCMTVCSPSPCDYRPQSSTTDTGELLADTCCVFLPPSVSKQLPAGIPHYQVSSPPHSLTHTLTPSPSRGMSPASAELVYIKLAQQLPEYGHESFQTLVGGHWPPSTHPLCTGNVQDQLLHFNSIKTA